MQRRKLWTVGLSLVLSLFAVGGWQGGALPTKALYAASSTPTATAIPSTRAVISPDNVDQLHRLGTLGKGPVGNFVWPENGQYLAVTTATGIWRYDVNNAAASPQVLGDNKGRNTLASSDDGKILAWPNGRDLIIWDTGIGKMKTDIYIDIPAEQNFMNDVVVSRDGSVVVATDSFSTLYVYKTRTGEQYAVRNRAPSSMVVHSETESLAPDGSLLAVSDDLKGLFVIQLGTSDLAPLETTLPKAHSMSVAFSRDGRLLAVGYGDGEIWIANVITRQVVQHLQGQTSPLDLIAFSPDGNLLVANHQGGVAEFWDVAASKVRFVVHHAEHWGERITFSVDSKVMLTTTPYDDTNVWDTATGRIELSLSDGVSAAMSPDGTTLAAVYRGTVGFWDVDSGKLIKTLAGHNSISSARFPGPGSESAATLDAYKQLRVYDTSTGTETSHSELPVSVGRDALFEADGTTLITGGEDGLVHIIDTKTQQVKHSLITNTSIRQLALSRDGKTLAAACDGGLFLWDISTGERLWVASDSYLSVSFSGDGKLLAALTATGKGQVWDVATHTLYGVIVVYIPQLHVDPNYGG